MATAWALPLVDSAAVAFWATAPENCEPYCARVALTCPSDPAGSKVAMASPAAPRSSAPRPSPMLKADWPAVAVRSSWASESLVLSAAMSPRMENCEARAALTVSSRPNSAVAEAPPAAVCEESLITLTVTPGLLGAKLIRPWLSRL